MVRCACSYASCSRRYKLKVALILYLTLFVPVFAVSQAKAGAIHNADVLQMVKAGLPAEVIIAKIRASRCNFDTSVPALSELTKNAVPASVVTAMIAARADTQEHGVRLYVAAESTRAGKWGLFGNRNATAAGGVGGVDPQRDELIKTVMQRCPEISVTINPRTADYGLDMQREPNKGVLMKRNKWSLSDHEGTILASGADRSVGGVAEDACAALRKARAIASDPTPRLQSR